MFNTVDRQTGTSVASTAWSWWTWTSYEPTTMHWWSHHVRRITTDPTVIIARHTDTHRHTHIDTHIMCKVNLLQNVV